MVVKRILFVFYFTLRLTAFFSIFVILEPWYSPYLMANRSMAKTWKYRHKLGCVVIILIHTFPIFLNHFVFCTHTDRHTNAKVHTKTLYILNHILYIFDLILFYIFYKKLILLIILIISILYELIMIVMIMILI